MPTFSLFSVGLLRTCLLIRSIWAHWKARASWPTWSWMRRCCRTCWISPPGWPSTKSSATRLRSGWGLVHLLHTYEVQRAFSFHLFWLDWLCAQLAVNVEILEVCKATAHACPQIKPGVYTGTSAPFFHHVCSPFFPHRHCVCLSIPSSPRPLYSLSSSVMIQTVLINLAPHSGGVYHSSVWLWLWLCLEMHSHSIV